VDWLERDFAAFAVAEPEGGAAEGLALASPGTAASAPEEDGDAEALWYAAAGGPGSGEFRATGAGFPPPPEKAQASRPSTARPAAKVTARRRQYVSGSSDPLSSR
jgi:hypothetical protein